MNDNENNNVTSLDAKRLRKCFGRFATGVTVVTTRVDDVTHGITVNAFTSVSLEPPLVLVSIAGRSRACELLEGQNFVVNVLCAQHARLAMHFAGAAPAEEAIDWEEGTLGPRLAGCLAHIECSPWRSHPAGDHTLFIGRVRHVDMGAEDDPLVFYAGQFQPARRDEAQDVVRRASALGGGWLGDEPLWQDGGGRPIPRTARG